MYKKKKRGGGVHVPAVVGQVFLHTLWKQCHLLSPEIWSPRPSLCPPSHTGVLGSWGFADIVTRLSPSAALISTCRWSVKQCDGYTPEICSCLFCLFPSISAAEGRRRGHEESSVGTSIFALISSPLPITLIPIPTHPSINGVCGFSSAQNLFPFQHKTSFELSGFTWTMLFSLFLHGANVV